MRKFLWIFLKLIVNDFRTMSCLLVIETQELDPIWPINLRLRKRTFPVLRCFSFQPQSCEISVFTSVYRGALFVLRSSYIAVHNPVAECLIVRETALFFLFLQLKYVRWTELMILSPVFDITVAAVSWHSAN